MSSPADESEHGPGLDPQTLAVLERAGGALATRAVARMDEELPWFRSLPAADRSWVTLVAQAGLAGFSDWLAATGGGRTVDDATGHRISVSVFSAAPRELLRSVSLRRTVELVRLTIAVAEEHLPQLVPEPLRPVVTTSLLHYSREIAFSAAAIYAAAAESRGAWDDRLEALVIDGIVRGEDLGMLESRAAALTWDPTLPTVVIVGTPLPDRPRIPQTAAGLDHRRYPVLTGRQADRLIVVAAAASKDLLAQAVPALIPVLFADGPVVTGPVGENLRAVVASARHALAGLRAVPAWPSAPRPVAAGRLLTERILLGDPDAREVLHEQVFRPLLTAGGTLIATLDAYATNGGALEPAARDLFVHPNTVRYRLHRAAQVTGLDPWQPRDLRTLELAITLGRLLEAGTATSSDR